MRHFRAFLYFFVGVLIALNASFAFAGKYVPGGYYQYGNQVTRKFKDYEDSKRLTNTMQEVYKADSNSLGITTQFAFGMEAQMTAPRVTDSYKIPMGPLVDAGAKAAARGFNGLRGGVPGVLGAVAGGLLFDIFVDQGLQYLDNQWNSTAPPPMPTSCGAIPKPPCADYTYYQGYSGFPVLYWQSTPLLSLPSSAALVTAATAVLPSTFRPYTGGGCTVSGSWATCSVTGVGKSYTGQIQILNSSKPLYKEQGTPVPLTEAQLNDTIKRAIESSMLPFVDAMQQDGTPIELDDGIQATTVGDSATSQPKTTTSTQINPDGSRIIENKTTTFILTPVGTGTIGGDITLDTETTTQTTTNTCAADGTCDVTEKTETETDSAEKTDCEKNPSALSCVGLGDIPNADIPANEKRVSLIPHTFNMTAACPAPVQFAVRGQTYFVSYQPICDFAGFIKALVLISAVVSAYFICFGTRREGN